MENIEYHKIEPDDGYDHTNCTLSLSDWNKTLSLLEPKNFSDPSRRINMVPERIPYMDLYRQALKMLSQFIQIAPTVEKSTGTCWSIDKSGVDPSA